MELTQLEAAWRLSIAALIGLGVGVEREWSGHAAGPGARFAGVRTFLLLGLLGGSAGLLLAKTFTLAAAVVVAGGMVLTTVAYAMAVQRPGAQLDGTTEAAGLVVISLGLLAGIGWLGLAAGAGSVVVLALREKERLHWLVGRMDERELRGALQFAALALVVLPLLPTGPLWGDLAVRPRALCTVVLLFSGLNFAGYVARRAVGAKRGYGFTGALGGFISSTMVTLTFARHSHAEPELGDSLARGVIAACTVLIGRVLVLSTVLYAPIGMALLPLLVPQALVGIALVAGRLPPDRVKSDGPEEPASPLRVQAAIRMAIGFQVAIVALAWAQRAWGTLGAFASGAVLGLTDMDALTYSMSRPDTALPVAVAARVIAVGVIANSVLKMTVAVVLGGKAFRLRAGVGLGLFAVAGAVALLVF